MACQCKPKDREKWRVADRNCNYSAFSGYHYTPSNYSRVVCIACKHTWRTRARYVGGLLDLQTGEW